MKRIIGLGLLAFVAYVGISLWRRQLGQAALNRDVERLLNGVPWDAKELPEGCGEELKEVVAKHGFTLKKGAFAYAAASTNRRPPSGIGTTSYVDHELTYTYMQPSAPMPFLTQKHEVKSNRLVEISRPPKDRPRFSAEDVEKVQSSFSQGHFRESLLPKSPSKDQRPRSA